MIAHIARRAALVVILFAVALVPSTGFAQQPAAAAPAAASDSAPSVTPPADAVTTASGLATKVLTAGTPGGTKPTAEDIVKFKFVGYKQDGTSFNSPPNYSARLGTIAVPGLAEGLLMMVPGESRRFWIPEKLAYKGKDPKGMLIFDVELIAVDGKQQ